VLDRLADQQREAEQDEEHHEEQREQNERNALGDSRDVGEPERARDERNDQENDRLFELAGAPGPSRFFNGRGAASFPDAVERGEWEQGRARLRSRGRHSI